VQGAHRQFALERERAPVGLRREKTFGNVEIGASNDQQETENDAQQKLAQVNHLDWFAKRNFTRMSVNCKNSRCLQLKKRAPRRIVFVPSV